MQNLKQVRAVEIAAEVRQVKTMADGSANLTINLQEECIPQAQVLMGWIGLYIEGVLELKTRMESDDGK